jgi:2-methylisocitrate lyase-like PEP mutase family enzyme
MHQIMQGATAFRALMAKGGLVSCPGVYDGISAKIAEQAGFDALYISGGAISRSMGYPDIALITFTEMVKRLDEIRSVTSLPLIMDADTGYGNEMNVVRMVRAYERFGAAGFHIEDQLEPKKCGHYEGKAIIETAEMVAKIKAAVYARQNPDTVIIARTDSRAIAGIDEAIARGNAYAEAGADVVFVEAPQSEAEIEQVAREVKAPKLINMFWGGKTPIVAPDKLAAMGYRIMIMPSDLQRAAIRAMQQAAALLKRDGNTAAMADAMVSFKEREAIIGKDVDELQKRFGTR